MVLPGVTQAPDLDAFWQNLNDGVDCVEPLPRDRWSAEDYRALGVSSFFGGFLEDIAGFDPLFFNISPRDAELMDPQERLFLDIAWETFENAGYGQTRNGKATSARQNIGVFVGVLPGSQLYGAEQSLAGGQSLSGNAAIANRVSYFFDFSGQLST